METSVDPSRGGHGKGLKEVYFHGTARLCIVRRPSWATCGIGDRTENVRCISLDYKLSADIHVLNTRSSGFRHYERRDSGSSESGRRRKLVSEDPDATLTQTTTSRLARVGELMLERRH